jgi:hypothetical protein
MANGEAGKKEDPEYYGPYAEYSKTLRAWFVAYGIGGPVVLLSSDKAWDSLVKSGCGRYVGFLFISGGIIQILSALLNKHSMWLLYLEEDEAKERRKKSLPDISTTERRPTYKLAEWYSKQTWVDVLLDIYTLLLFGWATRLAFEVLSSEAGVKVCLPYHGDKIYMALIFMAVIFVIYPIIKLIIRMRAASATSAG